ncbi:MAG TPA: hypothetical protein VEU30_16695, partial [Thermoanaerobaculia bacterium]|nr:hypothetical protein [Thermoanaerobaculia bacterium]
MTHRLYVCELLTNPLALAIVTAPARLPLVVAARYVQIAVLNHAMAARLTWRQMAMMPLLDLLMLYAWFVPF